MTYSTWKLEISYLRLLEHLLRSIKKGFTIKKYVTSKKYVLFACGSFTMNHSITAG